ncbi:hypothetical protein [Paraburkholderia sp. SIMBA_054]|uniref:hypothetical protein n=1 Tax=Paraburkholderia sp. SIMBA_054 TaxID=3085795 RepID=UPI00397BE848
MKYAGIEYEAFGPNGPVMREARTIHELPSPPMRLQALGGATEGIAAAIGLAAQRIIPFGTPVYVAFGLRPADAKRHIHAKLLLTLGCDVSLAYCG